MIIVNARFLTQQITGVQRFAVEICKELKKSNLRIEFVAPKNTIHDDLVKVLEVKTNLPFGFLKGHLWEQIALPYYVAQQKGCLISFCNTAPLFVKNQIITIHDLGFKVHPEWFSKPFTIFYNFLIPKIARRSKHIITVSKSSKNEIVKEIGVDEGKISVIYNGVSPIFEINNHYDNIGKEFESDYILTVSSLNPRKNFSRLIQAFSKIEDSSLKLYIIGNPNKNFADNDLVVHLKDDRVKFFNNVEDAELALFYKKAKLFVYPSLYEGFGIPIIEALSMGAKICVSDIPVFHEICGENAIYFNPKDINSIKNKIVLALENNTHGKISLKKYSWKHSAKQVEKCIFDTLN